MKFFHVYDERYYEGLVKNNFINEDTGYKLMNVFRMPVDKHFNTVAKKGGRLHSLIKENKNPFYIDRLSGGTRYFKFDYDKELICEYANILGEWFLGFQHHEGAANRIRCDWDDIYKQTGSKGPYDVKKLKELFMSDGTGTFYGSAGKEVSLLTHGNPEDYAPLKFPETEEEIFEDFLTMYKSAMESVAGYILPVDSYYLLPKLQDELGIRTFMPEVGWQIEQTRLAASLVRGVAKEKDKLWGLYFEPWFIDDKIGYTIPNFNNEVENEWFHNEQMRVPIITESGPNGGPSRLLQKRIYYYALMAGADYLSEEWGHNCSYVSKKTFELSEYGLAKKEFIEFMRDYKTVKPEIPFAIVLPLSYKCVQISNYLTPYEFGKNADEYIWRPFENEERRKYIAHIEDTLAFVYARNGNIYGNESFILTNSRFGDLFDIIYEDASDEILGKYYALIDATPDSAFAKKKGNKFRVLETTDFDKLEQDIRKLSEEVMPCTVDTLHWILSKDKKGRRFVSVFNNEGNIRDSEIGDTLVKEADARVKISFKEASNLKPIKLSCDEIKIEKSDDNTYYVDVPAAAFAIFEY
ncbi:MAG: hypothetical protein IKU65_00210 [Oscillospiraceae bacterium]|nr:hypothetical protein [Oscillospiraceae bacterium]